MSISTISVAEHLTGEAHKCEAFLIASTLLVMKAENVETKRWKQSSSIKQHLEAPHKDVHWLNHVCYMDELKSVQCHLQFIYVHIYSGEKTTTLSKKYFEMIFSTVLLH